jgi:hypothetical protein
VERVKGTEILTTHAMLDWFDACFPSLLPTTVKLGKPWKLKNSSCEAIASVSRSGYLGRLTLEQKKW